MTLDINNNPARELYLGIYEMRQDTLAVALANPGYSRPADFNVPPPSETRVFFFTQP